MRKYSRCGVERPTNSARGRPAIALDRARRSGPPPAAAASARWRARRCAVSAISGSKRDEAVEVRGVGLLQLPQPAARVLVRGRRRCAGSARSASRASPRAAREAARRDDLGAEDEHHVRAEVAQRRHERRSRSPPLRNSKKRGAHAARLVAQRARLEVRALADEGEAQRLARGGRRVRQACAVEREAHRASARARGRVSGGYHSAAIARTGDRDNPPPARGRGSMPDWQERITRRPSPALARRARGALPAGGAAHRRERRLVRPRLRHGIAAAAAAGRRFAGPPVLVGPERDGVAQAASAEAARRVEVVADLRRRRRSERVSDALRARRRRGRACHVLRASSSTSPPSSRCSSALVRARGTPSRWCSRCPTTRSAPIENPPTPSAWGEGAFDELRRLAARRRARAAPGPAAGLGRRWPARRAGDAGTPRRRRRRRADAPPTHFLAAFGPRGRRARAAAGGVAHADRARGAPLGGASASPTSPATRPPSRGSRKKFAGSASDGRDREFASAAGRQRVTLRGPEGCAQAARRVKVAFLVNDLAALRRHRGRRRARAPAVRRPRLDVTLVLVREQDQPNWLYRAPHRPAGRAAGRRKRASSSTSRSPPGGRPRSRSSTCPPTATRTSCSASRTASTSRTSPSASAPRSRTTSRSTSSPRRAGSPTRSSETAPDARCCFVRNGIDKDVFAPPETLDAARQRPAARPRRGRPGRLVQGRGAGGRTRRRR